VTLPFQAIYNNIIKKLYYKGEFNKKRKEKEREKKLLPMVVPVIHPPTCRSCTHLPSWAHTHTHT
jgi:peroxiredoxin